MKSNESIRDKMKPKSSEEIKNVLSKYTPNEKLMMGVRNGELWLVKRALMDGADINFSEGSPFIWAYINQNTDIIEYMLNKGVEVNDEVIRKIGSYGYKVPDWLITHFKEYIKDDSKEYIDDSKEYKSKGYVKKTNEGVRDTNGVGFLRSMMTGLSNKMDEYQKSFTYLIEQITVKFNVDVTYVERGTECDIYIEDKIDIKALIKWIKDNSDFVITDYNKYKSGTKRITISSPKTNESLRDKMTPKSFEDLEKLTRNMTTEEKITYGLIHDINWLVSQGISEIPNWTDYQLKIASVRFTNPRVRKSIKDELKKRGIEKDVKWTNLIGQRIDESLRDKMTPKSFEDILLTIDSLDMDYEPYKNIIKSCAKRYVSVSLKRTNDHSYRYTFKLDNMLYTVSCYHLLDEPWKMKLTVTRNQKWSKDRKFDIHSMEDVMNIIGQGEKVLESVRDMMTPRSTDEIRKMLRVMLSSVIDESKSHFDKQKLTKPMDLGETAAFYILDEIPIEEIYEEVYDRKTGGRTLVLNSHIKEIMDELLIDRFPSWTKRDIESFWIAFQVDKENDYYK
jgi:uncharacterized ubiquitin-like protein YukD